MKPWVFKSFFLLLILFPPILWAQSTVPTLDQLQPQIDALFHPVVQGGWCPGMAIGLMVNGKTRVWGYGVTSSNNSNPPGGDTEFEIGSITKLFTKLLFLDMIRQKKMGLNDLAQSYLPKNVKLPVKDGREITLLMLSNHSSGLPRDPDDMDLSHLDPQGGYTVDQLYNYLSRCQLIFIPGRDVRYSNLGVALLAHLISLKSGLTFEDYLDQRIINPLGMTGTGIFWTDAQKANAADGHTADGETVPLWNWTNPALAGCGALHSTINDLLKLGQAALDKDSSPLGDIAFDSIAEKTDWGPRVAHAGETFGFTSLFYVDRAKKIILVCWINNASSYLLNAIPETLKVFNSNKPTPLSFQKLVKLTPGQLEPYTGHYHVVEVGPTLIDKVGDPVLIRTSGDHLSLTFKGDPRNFGLYPEDSDNFYLKNDDCQMAFNRDLQGKVVGLSATTQFDLKIVRDGYQSPLDKIGDDIPPPP